MIVRATQDTFTVSAGVVITNPEGKVLLLDHHIRPNSGWGLPGGFIEHGEQPETGARREVLEETGLDLGDLKLLRFRTVRTHIEIIFRGFSDGEPAIRSSEIKGLGWFDLSSLPEGMGAGQRDYVTRVLSGID